MTNVPTQTTEIVTDDHGKLWEVHVACQCDTGNCRKPYPFGEALMCGGGHAKVTYKHVDGTACVVKVEKWLW